MISPRITWLENDFRDNISFLINMNLLNPNMIVPNPKSAHKVNATNSLMCLLYKCRTCSSIFWGDVTTPRLRRHAWQANPNAQRAKISINSVSIVNAYYTSYIFMTESRALIGPFIIMCQVLILLTTKRARE